MTEHDGPLPVDEVNEGTAMIGRSDSDMIFAVLPPVLFAGTYLLLTTNHYGMSCDFVASMAYHMKENEVAESGVASRKIIDTFVDLLKAKHGIEELSEGMWHKGTKDTFDGLYYAEFHPLELAAVAEIMQEIKTAAPPPLPIIDSIMEFWIRAGAKYVNDAERLAVVTASEGVA